MTVGEKIQFYRKKNGMSQEELGQKLLVSRQTVSLWEMDRTMPTVDNLILLKNIFGISLDELLCGEQSAVDAVSGHSNDEPCKKETSINEDTQPGDAASGCSGESFTQSGDADRASDDKPSEVYKYRYTKSDFAVTFKRERTKTVLFLVLCLAVFLYVRFWFLDSRTEVQSYLIYGFYSCGMILLLFRFFRTFIVQRKEWKRVCNQEYVYEVYDDFFRISIIKNGELISYDNVRYKDVERVEKLKDDLLYIALPGYKGYCIRKYSLNFNSKLAMLFDRTPGNKLPRTPEDRQRIISIFLIVLSILSFLAASVIEAEIVDDLSDFFTGMKWIYFLFLPIPLSSLLFGLYLRKNRFTWAKNAVVGIVVCVLLCMQGFIYIKNPSSFSRDDKAVKNAEKLLSISLPDTESAYIVTENWSRADLHDSRCRLLLITDASFAESAAGKFENSIVYDGKWLSEIPEELVPVTSTFCDYLFVDMYLVYNEDTKQFNSLPESDGVYRFMNIVYSSEGDYMYIVEYEVEYKK